MKKHGEKDTKDVTEKVGNQRIRQKMKKGKRLFHLLSDPSEMGEATRTPPLGVDVILTTKTKPNQILQKYEISRPIRTNASVYFYPNITTVVCDT